MSHKKRTAIPRRLLWVETNKQGRLDHYPFHLVTLKAELLDNVGNWAEAEGLYRQQLAWAEESGSAKHQADSLNALGWMHHQKNDDDKARELISRALSFYEQLGDYEGQGRAHSQLGGTYYQNGGYDSALSHYRRGLEISRRSGDLQAEAKALNNIGNILGEQGDNDGALRLYEKSLDVSLKTGNAYMEAVVGGNIGAAHFAKGDYRAARDWFLRQLELGTRLGNKYVVTSAYGSLAGVHLKTGDSEKALGFLGKRLEISEELGDIKGQALAWDYRGNIHYTRGEHDLAEKAFRKAVELGEKANIRYYLSGFLRNLASVCLETERADEAEEANRRALMISEEMRLPEMVAECRLLAAKISSRKDPPAAVAGLRQLLGGPLDDEQRAEALRLIYEWSGEEASRLAALEIYRKLNQSNPTEEYAQRIGQMEKGRQQANQQR